MKQLPNFLKKHKYYLYTILVVTLIIVHGKFDSFFKIDSLTLLLLLVLLVLPYIPLIKTWKFKYGDFETEVTTEEINEIERKIDKIPQKPKEIEDEEILNLRELAETDPQLAIVKIRIELEKQLRLLFNIYVPENRKYIKNLSPRTLVESLKKRNVIEKPLSDVLQDIIGVSNRTIHGEDISVDNAVKLIDTYQISSAELEYVIIDHALKTAKEEIIEQTTVDEYYNAEYIVTTIIPLVHNPQKKVYKINQAELDAFLDGYNEYAEFIVELRKIDKNAKLA